MSRRLNSQSLTSHCDQKKERAILIAKQINICLEKYKLSMTCLYQDTQFLIQISPEK